MAESIENKEKEQFKDKTESDQNKAVVRVVLIIFGFLILFGMVAGGTSSTSYDTPRRYDENFGYDKNTASELRRVGIDPSEARAIEEACGSACE